MIFPNLGGIPSNVHHSSSSTELLPWHNKSIQVCRVLIVGRAGLAAHQKRVDRAGHAVFAAGPASSGYGTAGWSRPVRWPAARNGRRRRRSADGFDAFLVVFGLETGPAADAQSGSGRGPDAADGPAAAAASVRNGQRRGRRRPDAVLGRCLRHRAADAARWTRTAEKEVRQRSLAWQETGAITLGLTSFSHSFSVSLSFSLSLSHSLCVCVYLSLSFCVGGDVFGTVCSALYAPFWAVFFDSPSCKFFSLPFLLAVTAPCVSFAASLWLSWTVCVCLAFQCRWWPAFNSVQSIGIVIFISRFVFCSREEVDDVWLGWWLPIINWTNIWHLATFICVEIWGTWFGSLVWGSLVGLSIRWFYHFDMGWDDEDWK